MYARIRNKPLELIQNCSKLTIKTVKQANVLVSKRDVNEKIRQNTKVCQWRGYFIR